MTSASPSRKRGAKAEVPITREVIVETAFRLIEERGLVAFSMRSLAGELGVFPATLYWHAGDRSELLGLVEYEWIRQVPLPDECDDWRDWLLELGRRYRRHAFSFPEVARLATIERTRNTESLRVLDAVLGKLSGLGLGDDVVHVYNSLVGAVRGFVLMEIAPRSDSGGSSAADAEAELRGLDPEQFPNFTEHFEVMGDRSLSLRWTESVERPLDDSFEFLMHMLIEGIERRIARG